MSAVSSSAPAVNPSGSAASRNSSGSARSPRHRAQVNLGTIEKSVTHLLVATKQLLETLTAWSRQQATEAEVSDVYVRLGSEFNIACRAFTAIGVETADLGNVPDALRTILESTLSQDASPQSLDVYLPRIREIIINLLHGLKRKQQKLRQKQTKDSGDNSAGGRERGSGGSSSQRTGSIDSTGDEVAPPRTSSLPGGNGSQRDSPPMQPTGSVRESTASMTNTTSLRRQTASSSNGPSNGLGNDQNHQLASSESGPPYPTIEEPMPIPSSFSAPPPSQPPGQDALSALAQKQSLERRASQRYSAYQIAKMTGRPAADIPLPSTRDPSSLPRNRESMEAVRKRSSAARSRSNARREREEASPMKKASRISEEHDLDGYSPIAKTPEDKIGPAIPTPAETKAPLTVDTGPPPSAPIPVETVRESTVLTNGAAPVPTLTHSPERRTSASSDTKDLTLFLQLGRSVKKVNISDIEELSLTSVRLLFISKFSYSPPSGDDFPDIYLQDSVSGVRYELEDLRDVKDRAVLCLNVEVLDEVKRHIDDGMDGLKKLVQGIAGSVESQALQISRVAERQEETAKQIAELAVAPRTTSAAPPSSTSTPLSLASTEKQLDEVRDLRKDLAVLKQVYSTFVADMSTSMATIKTKAGHIKEVAAVAPNEGRVYVEKGKTTLASDADILVNRVDDLQDTVEDLRKDVVARGVRPLPRQLELVSKEIAQARAELKKMNDYILREKPLFRRIWERELEVVCEEQEFFNMQESLMTDLEDDLEKAMQTFALVEQCSQQQLKTTVNGLRSTSRGFVPVNDDLDPADVKDNVLSEVRALQPNHEGRLEAIERAERARQKELEGRIPEFQKELGKFVEENKLKKVGGAEEVERIRAMKEEQTRREMWERQKQMEEEEEESSEEEETDDEN